MAEVVRYMAVAVDTLLLVADASTWAAVSMWLAALAVAHVTNAGFRDVAHHYHDEKLQYHGKQHGVVYPLLDLFEHYFPRP